MWRREKNNLTLLRPTSYMLHDILTHYTCKVELITVESQDSYTDVIDSTRLVNCIQNSSEFQQLANSIKQKCLIPPQMQSGSPRFMTATSHMSACIRDWQKSLVLATSSS